MICICFAAANHLSIASIRLIENFIIIIISFDDDPITSGHFKERCRRSMLRYIPFFLSNCKIVFFISLCLFTLFLDTFYYLQFLLFVGLFTSFCVCTVCYSILFTYSGTYTGGTFLMPAFFHPKIGDFELRFVCVRVFCQKFVLPPHKFQKCKSYVHPWTNSMPVRVVHTHALDAKKHTVHVKTKTK